MTETTTRTVTLPDVGDVPVTLTTQGTGSPVLLLHGGGGPQTVAGYAGRFAAAGPRARPS
jgi:pimeloyl-ACP methyl ester carboxylesterase